MNISERPSYTKATKGKIAILGFGEEGRAVLQFLRRSPHFKEKEIWVLDRNPKLKVPRHTKQKLGVGYLENLDRFQAIFRSPGISPELPELKKASQLGTLVSSGTRLFFEEAPCKIVGITGSKGKSTAATLLYKILREDGRDVCLAGNIGNSPLPLLSKLHKKSIVILELSSFQLQDLPRSPHIAIVLDIFPEHLDYHGNFRAYFEAKSNIAKNQKPGDKIFYFKNNRHSAKIAKTSPGKKVPVHLHYRAFESYLSYSPLRGMHNFKNALMALTVARSLRTKPEAILSAIKAFGGLPHRLEFIKTVRVNQPPIAISFYNDSASTNPHATAAALSALKEPKILICGGKDKGLDYKPLARALKNSKVLQMVLFGENRYRLARALRKTPAPLLIRPDLEKAVASALDIAKSIDAYPEISVIFSPASASFDMFRDYKERGEKFAQIVKKI